MEDAKSDYLESTFGETPKEMQIGNIYIVIFSNSCPDLLVLSGADCSNLICLIAGSPCIKTINTKNENIVWTINLRCLDV